MGALDWLFARPIAHRGLHDRSLGVIENTPTAVTRAIEAGYGVEIDVRETADGGAIVIHDGTLDRLTSETGRIADRTVAELRRIRIEGSADRLWTLEDCLDLVGDRAALVIEVKIRRRQDMEHARRVAERVAQHQGQVALKSFDPRAIRVFARHAPDVVRGVIGKAFKRNPATVRPSGARERRLERAIGPKRVHRLDFLSWDVADIDRAEVAAFRATGRPVMTWTVKGPADWERALAHADQIVFEGFAPDQNR